MIQNKLSVVNMSKNGLNRKASKDIYLTHKTQSEFDSVWNVFEEVCHNANIQVNPSLIQKCQPLSNEFGFYTIVPRDAVFNCSDKQFNKLRREIVKESKVRRRSIQFILTIYYGLSTAFWCVHLSPYVFTMTAFSDKSSLLQTHLILLAYVISIVEGVFADKGWLPTSSYQHKPEVLLGKSAYRFLFLAICTYTYGFVKTSSGLPLLLFIWSFSAAVRSALSLVRYSAISDWILQNDAFIHGVVRPSLIINGLQTHFFKFSLPVCSISEIWCCQELLLSLNLGRFLSTIALLNMYGLFCVVYFTTYTMYAEEAAAKSQV